MNRKEVRQTYFFFCFFASLNCRSKILLLGSTKKKVFSFVLRLLIRIFDAQKQIGLDSLWHRMAFSARYSAH